MINQELINSLKEVERLEEGISMAEKEIEHILKNLKIHDDDDLIVYFEFLIKRITNKDSYDFFMNGIKFWRETAAKEGKDYVTTTLK